MRAGREVSKAIKEGRDLSTLPQAAPSQVRCIAFLIHFIAFRSVRLVSRLRLASGSLRCPGGDH
jgi:hypothetical protein